MFTEYFEIHNLRALLAPRGARLPFPPASVRQAWEGLPAAAREELLRAGEAQHASPYPMLLATQFLAFCRDGSRKAYEDPHFARRGKLLRAMLAECTLYDGRYVDDIVDGIWCICEESFWGVSAHNGSDHPGARPAKERPLPDVANPYIDLFAAQSAALLAWTCFLLRDTLDAVSPLVIRRVTSEIRRRVLDPFHQHDDFWWMGMIRQDVNNWTPWILSNIIAVLLLVETDEHRLAEGLTRALRMLDAYLAVMPDDGGCDEGAAYWNMAGGALLDCLELIDTATGGRVRFYDEPKIQRIGAFPLHAHIAGPYFWNFADCDAMPPLDGERVARYGALTGNTPLQALGASIAPQASSVLPKDTPETSRVLRKLFCPVAPVAASSPAAQNRRIALPNLQVWAAEREGFYVACKGGHNGENHNHNDVGSWFLYVDGQPVVIDVGNMLYTAQTFRADTRYTLFNTRSRNHNLPLIGDTEQAAGALYAAREMHMEADAVSVDIAGAYPPEAGVRTLRRCVCLPQQGLLVHDVIDLTHEQPVTWVFMLRHKPEVSASQVRTGPIHINFGGALTAMAEEFEIQDARMARNFPGSVWRLTLTAAPAVQHDICFAIHRT